MARLSHIFRTTELRIVDPPRIDCKVTRPINLWHMAKAAADETVQGATVMIASWLNLFSSHLSHQDLVTLRWKGDLAESAEVRRAYSALYGRYMSRALLSSELGIRDFTSLLTNTTRIPKSGVTIQRGPKGDIPDWIGWDPRNSTYVLGEAKGNISKGLENSFLRSKPKCIRMGKAQFGRVSVTGPRGPIATKNWVVANLWATDDRSQRSVSVLWDPPSQGDLIPHEERDIHARGIREEKLNRISETLGYGSLTMPAGVLDAAPVRITAKATPSAVIPDEPPADMAGILMPFQNLSSHEHQAVYIAALLTPFGIRPIRSEADIELVRGQPGMLYGIDIRSTGPNPEEVRPWLGEAGIVSTDGTALFDIRQIELEVL